MESPESKEAARNLLEAVQIMARLRGPDGCPWDREQTFDTIKRYTLEETYEVFDAIERRAWSDLKDELGDLFLQVLFYSQMAAEAGYFNISDVAANLNAKLIRRHPHVFGDRKAEDAATVLKNWEEIKREEKRAAGTPDEVSLLAEVSRSMPATSEARKLGARAAKVGFDWPTADDIFAKLEEEIAELRAEIRKEPSNANFEAIEEELGDLVFTVVNLARHLKVDPEFALRRANEKFRRRFIVMEREAGGSEHLADRGPEELDALWRQAKLSSEESKQENQKL
jgi:XTP/dITP diphosphohydrolase/ATP diphosphatase